MATARDVYATVAQEVVCRGPDDGLAMRDSVRYKLKPSDGGRPVLEGFSGDDLHRNTGRWMQKVQIVDRANDRYFKEVTDLVTRQIVRKCEEPLSHHRSKPKKP